MVNKVLLRCLCLSAISYVLLAAPCASQETVKPAPLEMTMVMLQSGPGLPVFELRLRNTGDHDLVVNIGMLAGTKQYPEAFHFSLLDASGTAYQLLRKGSLAGVAGRIDPLIVALPMEASFSFPVDLALYCSFAEGCPLRLPPSRYTIKADYDSSDQQDFEMFHIWKGRLQAPAIPFVVESN
jgi:hypothetical protein